MALARTDPIVVRAHLNPGGYVGDALSGTLADGLAPAQLDPGFAADVESAPPQPSGCLF